MDVTLPNGQTLKNLPEGTTKSQIAAKLKANGQDFPAEWLLESKADPFPVPPNIKRVVSKGEEYAVNVPDAPEFSAAASKGIDVLSGLPDPSVNSLIDYASGMEQKAAVLRGLLSKQFGKSVPVRASSTGDLEYLNPQTGRWTWRNPGRQHNYTLPGTIDTAGQTIGGIIGGGATAALTENPWATGAGTIAGSGAGGAVSGAINAKIAQSMGYDKKIGKAIEAGGTEGMVNAAIGETVLGALRGIRFFAKGSRFPLSIREGDALLKHTDEAIDQLKRFYELNGSSGFKPTVPNAVGVNTRGPSRNLYERSNSLYRGAASTTPEAGEAFNIHVDDNLNALTDTFKNITDRFKRPDPGAPFKSAAQVADEEKQAFIANTVAEQQMAESNLKAAAAGLPQMTPAQMRSELEQAVGGAYDQARAAADASYTKLRIAMGVKPEFLDPANKSPNLGGVPSALKISVDGDLRTELDNYLQKITNVRKTDGGAAAAMKSLIPDGLLKKETAQKLEFGISNEGVPTEKVLATKKVSQTDYTANLDSNNVLSYIQDIKDGVRREWAVKNGLAVPPSAKDEQDMVNMLQGWLHRSWKNAGRTDLVAMHEEAMQLAKQQADDFEKGMLKRLVKRGEGVTPVLDDQVISDVFLTGNGEGMKAVLNILHGAPEELNRVKQVALAAYLSNPNYYDGATGIPTAKGLNNYMRDYGASLRVLFNDNDMKQLSNLSTFASVFEKSAAETDRLVKFFNKTPLAKAGALNSESLSNQVMRTPKVNITQGREEDIALTDLFGKLDDATPELMEKVRYSVADKLYRRVTDPSGAPSAGAFDRLLGDKALVKRLRVTMGDQYVDDLYAVRTAAKINEYTASSTAIELTDKQPLLRNIMRIETGYWGPKGIAYSLILKRRAAAQARAVQNMLSDPAMLRRVVQAQRVSLGSPIVAGILGDLNATGLYENLQERK